MLGRGRFWAVQAVYQAARAGLRHGKHVLRDCNCSQSNLFCHCEEAKGRRSNLMEGINGQAILRLYNDQFNDHKANAPVKKDPREDDSKGIMMERKKYVFWKDDDMWLGYLDEYLNYITQGETLEELKENLKDIFNELNKHIIQG
jgi:predicted RNase H-like HicB family nuclease